MTHRIILLSFLFCLVCMNARGQDANLPFVATVNVEQVNVRAGQSANFEKIGELHKGDEVVVVSKSYSWYKIKITGGTKNFVAAKYVRVLNEHEGEIIADRVNVRARADINNTILTQLKKGTKVAIVKTLEGWYQIKPANENYGWLLEKFLTFRSRDVASFEEKQLAAQQNAVNPLVVEKVLPPPLPLEPAPKKIITVVGLLQREEGEAFETHPYTLVVDGQAVYSIKGINHILEDFLHYTVEVEGSLEKHTVAQNSYPVLVVSKLQLVL